MCAVPLAEGATDAEACAEASGFFDPSVCVLAVADAAECVAVVDASGVKIIGGGATADAGGESIDVIGALEAVGDAVVAPWWVVKPTPTAIKPATAIPPIAIIERRGDAVAFPSVVVVAAIVAA